MFLLYKLAMDLSCVAWTRKYKWKQDLCPRYMTLTVCYIRVLKCLCSKILLVGQLFCAHAVRDRR
jgi:hypothetical protein